MKTKETFFEDLAQIMTARGHLVVTSYLPQKIGQIGTPQPGPNYDCRTTCQPCRIVRETTRADFVEQCDLIGESVRDDFHYFYVIETD
jgi:hypothetical protein